MFTHSAVPTDKYARAGTGGAPNVLGPAVATNVASGLIAMNCQDLPPELLFHGKKEPVNQMNRPSRSSKVRSPKTRPPRKPGANVSGVPQIFLGHKTIGELKILARLAASKEKRSSGLARLKKAA